MMQYAPAHAFGSKAFSPQFLRRWFVFWWILSGVLWIQPDVGLLVCGGLAIHALRGSRYTVEALAILAFLLIYGKGDTSLGRWIVLFASAVRVLWNGVFGQMGMPKVLVSVIVFAVPAFVSSAFYSAFPAVSLLKLVSFLLGVVTVLTAFYQIRHLESYWLSWLYTLALFILSASIAALGSGMGYEKSTGFQGILVHPQTFGPILAPVASLFTGLYLFQSKRSPFVISGMVLSWIGMFMSLSRTSVLAVLLGFAIVSMVAIFIKSSKWGPTVTDGIFRPEVIIAGLLMLALLIPQLESVEQGINEFIFKYDEASSLAGSFAESRGGRTTASMDNFYESPILGIGFGAPSNPKGFEPEYGPTGIPISATVEKGFMPTAVLEETGIVGAILLSIFLIMLIGPVVRNGTPTLLWMMLSGLFVNLGEMIFFSFGGMGFFFWIVYGFCYATATVWGERGAHPVRQRRHVGKLA